MTRDHLNGELPEGWIHPYLKDVAEINPPKPRPDALDGDAAVTFVPMAAVDADSGRIAKPEQRLFGDVRKGYTGFADGDVILAKITPCFENGKAAIARSLTNGLGFGSSEFHVLRPSESVLPEYLFHYVRQESFRQAGAEHMTSTAGQARVPVDYLRTLRLPLPPIGEQRRIVTELETLMARVDAARERLLRVSPLLKRTRQALLTSACSGKLTEEWRATALPEPQPTVANSVARIETTIRPRPGRLWGGGAVPELTVEERDSIPIGWEWVKVGQLGADPDAAVQIGPMSMRSAEFEKEGVPVLNVGCIQSGWIDPTKCNYLPSGLARQFDRYRVRPGDILFTRSGTVGRCAVAEEAHDGCLMTFHLLRVRPDPRRCLSEYLRIALEGAPTIRRQTSEGQIGSTRGGFNTKLLASLDVPLPPMHEQQEIIRRVEALFDLCDAVERRVTAARAQADQLTQALLARAFRGQLIPTEAELTRAAELPCESTEADSSLRR